MSDPDSLKPLLAALRDLLSWLEHARVPGLVIGGVAVSILGRPRVTRDIDAVVLLDQSRWDRFLDLGAQYGFVARRADAIEFARRARVLLVRHEPSSIDTDISFGALLFEEESIKRAVSVEVAGLSIPLPTPEDLIIMKAVAHRQRDLIDIESICDAHPKLDLKRVRHWVREFSTVLEMPEILDDLEKILARYSKHL